MTEPDDKFDADAFDAAFTAQFGEPLAEEPEPPHADEAPPDDDAPPGPAETEAGTVIAVVLTPVANPEVLARLMGLVNLTWPVFGTRTGAVAATRLPTDEVSQITGQAPAQAVQVAKVLSQTSEYGVVLLTSLVGQGYEGATGQIQAARYVAGEQTETLAPGLILAGVEESIERVLFGVTKPDEVAEVLDPTEVAKRPGTPPSPGTPPKRRWGRRP